MAPTPATDAPTLDAEAFRATWNSEPAAQRALLADYARANAEDAAALREAATQRNLDDIKRSAHRIAGAGQIVAATGVVAASRVVEAAARSGDWSATEAALPALHAEIERVDAFIRSL